MDKIKTEDADDIPIEYVTPNEIQHNSPIRKCTAIIIPKSDLESGDVLDCLDISVYDPTIIKHYDGSQLAPTTTAERTCQICKSFGVKRIIPLDQKKEQYDVCMECSSNYSPAVVLMKLKACRLCQKLDVKIPLIGRKQEHEPDVCSACSSKFLPKVFLLPLETTRTRFECFICKSTFDRFETLAQHMNQLNAMPTTVENVTTKKFVGSQNGNRRRMHESQNIKRHTCNQCEYATVYVSNLIRHYRKHSGVKNVRRFECKECGKKFTEKRTLVDHRRVHLDEDEKQKLRSQFKCSICAYSTLYESRLKDHMKIHVAVKPFECDVCSKRFYRKNILKIHIQSHCKDKIFVCNICPKKYYHKTGLTYHMETSHVDKALRKYKYTCYICKYNSMSLSYLRIHMRSHTGVRPFKCRLCPRSFTVNYQCTIHEATHSGEKRYFKCQICFKDLASKSGLRAHMETHLLESQRIKKYECDQCDNDFYKKKSLLRHQSKHNQKQENVRHVCPKCSKEFTKSAGLKTHMTIHGKYTFDCHFCVRHFSSADKLEIHENAKHKIAKFGRRTFECYVCRMAVKNRWKLELHLRKHFNERPFRCDICAKGFWLKSILQRHKQSHWNEEDKQKLKKFKCHLCEYKTAKRQGLNVHLERHINGPFRCNICSKDFPTEGRLSYHRRAHTGIYRNKYICYICNYVGVNITNVRNHMFKHTNEKPLRCEICDKYFKHRITLKRHQVTHMDKIELDKLKKLKCHLCDYATRNSHNLKRHIFTHTGSEKKASCTKCSMKFSDKTQLKSHMETHLDATQRIKKFKCNVCGFAFALSGNLNRHIASKHSATKPFACDKCPQKYSDPSSFKNHLRAHIETPNFCSQCPRRFAEKSELKKHMAAHKPKRFSCKLCPKKFSMKFDLKKHTKSIHSGSRPSSLALPCSKCAKTFNDQHSLNRHFQTHFNRPKNGLFECYICQYSANVKYKLHQHMLQH